MESDNDEELAEIPEAKHGHRIPTLQLYDHTDEYLIVKWPTGVSWCNQTGGHACLHPEQEGFLISLVPRWQMGKDLFEKGFLSDSWVDCVTPGEMENRINGILKQFSSEQINDLKLDSELLEQSHEAWLHVTFVFSSDRVGFSDCGPFRMKGVVTWENSD